MAEVTVEFRGGPLAGRQVRLSSKDVLHELVVTLEGNSPYVLGTLPMPGGLGRQVEWHTYRQATTDGRTRFYDYVTPREPRPITTDPAESGTKERETS